MRKGLSQNYAASNAGRELLSLARDGMKESALRKISVLLVLILAEAVGMARSGDD